MVKNKANENAYAEKFDLARLEEIAEWAMRDKIPNATFSDLECNVWSLFCRVIDRTEHGIKTLEGIY